LLGKRRKKRPGNVYLFRRVASLHPEYKAAGDKKKKKEV